MTRAFEQEARLETLLSDETVKAVAGFHNGISGKSALVSHMKMADGAGLAVATYPVVIEGSTVPICFTSWTYSPSEGPEAYNRAIEMCKKQAEWIVSRINAPVTKEETLEENQPIPNVAYYSHIMEYDEWGTRPDGYLVGSDLAFMKKKVDDLNSRRGNGGYNVYGSPKLCVVTEEMAMKIKAGGGVASAGNNSSMWMVAN